MKYLIYARVSPRGSDFDGETSIKMQIDICKDYVKGQGGEIAGILSDEFFSGKDTKRPGFAELMAQLESGTAEWDCLCVYKLSRLSRSTKDCAVIFDKFQKFAKLFVSVTEPVFNFSTPIGRAMSTIFSAINQFEREQSAENTRNKMISIARDGLWPAGNAPFGYKRGEKGDNKLYVDPRKAEIIRDVYDSYLDPSIMVKSIAEKYRSYFSQTYMLCTILRNKIYIGMIPYAGKLYPGKHEPIISQATFDAVQRKLPEQSIHSRPKAQKYPYLLSGLIRCHCGKFMTPASGKSGRYTYYKCTDRLSCNYAVSAPKIEKAVIDFIKEQPESFSPAIINAMRSKLQRLRDDYLSSIVRQSQNVKDALSEASKERDKIYSLMTNAAINDSNLPFFNQKLESLNQEITDLESKRSYFSVQRDNLSEDIDKMINDACSEITSFAVAMDRHKSNPENKRNIIRSYISKITATPDHTFNIEFSFFGTPKHKVWHAGQESNLRPPA